MARSAGLRLKTVLLINGVVDVLVAFVLIGFPALGIGLPGLKNATGPEAFLAGGWGVSTVGLAVARLWAWRKAEMRTPMGLVGIVEGLGLAAYTIVMLVAGKVDFVQALLPLLVGLVFGVLYALAMTIWRKEPAALPPQQDAAPAAPEAYRAPM
jgi:hypothetical protein